MDLKRFADNWDATFGRKESPAMSSGADCGKFLDGSHEATLKLLWERVEEAEEAAKRAGSAYASANQTYAEAKAAYQRAAGERRT
jgi:hypothetical protein